MNPAATTLDLSGLPPHAVGQLTDLATHLRLAHSPPPWRDPMGPSADEWVARLQAFCDAQPWQDGFVDDSRESIYEDRGL